MGATTDGEQYTVEVLEDRREGNSPVVLHEQPRDFASLADLMGVLPDVARALQEGRFGMGQSLRQSGRTMVVYERGLPPHDLVREFPDVAATALASPPAQAAQIVLRVRLSAPVIEEEVGGPTR